MNTENTDQTGSTPSATPGTLPAKSKTFVGKFLADIGSPFDWGVRDFGVIAKSFHNEAPTVQANLKAVSGMLQIIKLNIQEPPVVVIYLVKKAYPQFDEAKILSLLQSGVTDLSLAEKIVGEDLPSFLISLVQHVTGTTDTGWKLFWDGLFKAVAIVAVTGTVWEKLVSWTAYIYNVLVKPNVK